MNTLMKKFIYISFILFLFIFSPLRSQSSSNKEFIRAVQAADLYFYYNENFEKAASLYEVLHNKYPENSNISAKLGICYLNIDGKNAEALILLKKARSHIVKSDKDYLEYGQSAPIDTWFYLAHAYHINDSLNTAIILYNEVKRKIGSTEAFRTEYIDNQIKACNYALKMEKNPVKISSEFLFPWLNDYSGAMNPVISENDSVFIFTRAELGINHIYCSYKNNGWQKPTDITAQLGGYDNLCSNSITGQGDMLIVYMDDGADGNLFSSTRKGLKWTKLKKLNKNINTKYWEAHGFITPDGKKLFFSSNRPEGFGELDLWVSEKNENGDWGTALNLGNTINTPYNENTPFFIPSTGTLIFSSIGHNGLGGYDVFSSTLKNRKWTEPLGMPFPINTTSDNTTFISDPTGKGLITSKVDDQSKKRNIYLIVEGGLPSETIAADGNVGLEDGMKIVPGLAEINVAPADRSMEWKKIPVNDSGIFKFDTKPGDYVLRVKYAGYITDTSTVTIPESFTGKSMSVSISMVPEKVSSGDFLSIKSILFDFNSDKLNQEAIFNLEKLKSILNNYPELKIEVTGYTDIIGGQEYNKILAEKRAQTVVRYFTSSGISGSRFIQKAVGAADFVALNVNPDGSDNPEGRQYNRRVTLGIVNPQTGIVIRQETFTPPRLRQPYSMRYGVVLMKSTEKFYPDYFADFKMNELFFVRPVFKDSAYMYILGEFSDRSEAEKYLPFAKEKGFKDSYIVNQYEIQASPRQLINETDTRRRSGVAKIYIIQLEASKAPLNLNKYKPLEKVREIKGNDGFYRYVFGEFEGFSTAKKALDDVHNSGYKNAFIKEYGLLVKQ
jgi:outer membrane protein OmpA-like peptidoglycan-associated protein